MVLGAGVVLTDGRTTKADVVENDRQTKASSSENSLGNDFMIKFGEIELKAEDLLLGSDD